MWVHLPPTTHIWNIIFGWWCSLTVQNIFTKSTYKTEDRKSCVPSRTAFWHSLWKQLLRTPRGIKEVSRREACRHKKAQHTPLLITRQQKILILMAHNCGLIVTARFNSRKGFLHSQSGLVTAISRRERDQYTPKAHYLSCHVKPEWTKMRAFHIAII